MARHGSLAIGLAIALAASSILGTGTVGAGSWGRGEAARPSGIEPSDGLSTNVTWNGVGIGQASSAATAFVIGPGQSANVQFNYTEARGTAPVTNASLVLLYLGLTLSSVSIPTTTPAPVGGWQISWTFGSLIYLTEGVYQVDAQLLDANGSVLFQEPFYVDARAPYLVVSTIFAMAVILGLVELLWVRTVLRYRKSRQGRYRFR
jgi:hypothetical protein